MKKHRTLSALVRGIIVLFISSSANAWTISQSYDDQSVGEGCEGWGSSQSTVISGISASGSNACKQVIGKDETGFGKWGGIINFPANLYDGDEIWIRIRTFMPVGFDYDSTGEGNHLKFLRVRTYSPDGKGLGHNDWYINPKNGYPPFIFIYEGRQDLGWNRAGTSNDQIKLGQWETYEFYIKFGTVSVDDGGTSRMRAWKNGILLKDMTDRITLKNKDNITKALNVFTYWNGGSPKTQEMYVDDLVITSDKPNNKDKAGNLFIGVGDFKALPGKAPPAPPVLE